MTEILFPLNPRPREDPAAAGIVQQNLEYLSQLFTKGIVDGDTLVWDSDTGRFVAQAGTPTGVIVEYGGVSDPSGWMICDGRAVSRTNFAALFTVIGTAFGVGDGSTTFNIPDIRGRMPVGKGSHTDVDALGEDDGAALADRRPKHKHTVTDPGHTHPVDRAPGTGGANAFARGTISDGVHNTLSAVTGVTVGPQVSSPTDGPAFLVLNFIIKA